LPAFAANGPSFDCARAQSAQERLVCANDELAVLDNKLAQAFSAAKTAHPAIVGDLVRSQAAWLKNAAQCTGNPSAACLKQAYLDRIAQLQSKEFLVCGKPKIEALAFTVACEAPNNPQHLSFLLAGTSDGDKTAARASLHKLIVKAGNKSQTLAIDGDVWMDGVESAIALMDINFDGYDDIRLWTATSAGPNESYTYWLYDPKSARFAASDIGDKLSGFEIGLDPKARTVRASGRASCCLWEAQTYRWAGGELRLVTNEASGMLTLPDLPAFAGVDTQVCGIETDHYDAAGTHVTATDFAVEGCEDDKIKSAPVDLLSALKRSTRGFTLRANDKHHFTVVYDKPLTRQP